MNYLYLIIVTVLVSFFVSSLVWIHGYCWRCGVFSTENPKSFLYFIIMGILMGIGTLSLVLILMALTVGYMMDRGTQSRGTSRGL